MTALHAIAGSTRPIAPCSHATTNVARSIHAFSPSDLRITHSDPWITHSDPRITLQTGRACRAAATLALRKANNRLRCQCTRTVVSEYGARVIANDDLDTRVALCSIDELFSP